MGSIYEKKMTTNIEREIEREIEEKVCVSEMITMVERFIKGLESLYTSPSELKIVLDLLKN